jgi:MFS family permease
MSSQLARTSSRLSNLSIIPDAAPSATGFAAPIVPVPELQTQTQTDDEQLTKLTPVQSADEAESLNGDDLGPPPDGELDAWLCVLSAMFLPFCIFGFIMAFGQLQDYYLEHQLKGYDKATVAWLGSIVSFAEFSLAIFSGRFFDIHGARLLVVGCTVLSFVAMIGLAFSTKYWQFLLSFLGFGVAGSLAYAPSGAVVAHWFLRRRSTAIGIVICGSGIGGIVYPFMLEKLFQRLSYRDTMLIIGGFNFVLMLPACFFMKGRLPPRAPPPWSDVRKPWTEPPYVFLVLGAMLYGMNIMSPTFSALTYAQNNRLPHSISIYSIAILQAGSVVGRLGSGVLADAIGVMKVWCSIGLASAIVIFAFWVPPVGPAPAIIGLLLWGALNGGWFTLAGSATAAVSPLEETGMRFGMLITCLAVPSLVGPVISGALVTAANDQFRYAGIYIGAMFLVSGIVSNGVPVWTWWRKRGQVGAERTAEEASGQCEVGTTLEKGLGAEAK